MECESAPFLCWLPATDVELVNTTIASEFVWLIICCVRINRAVPNVVFFSAVKCERSQQNFKLFLKSWYMVLSRVPFNLCIEKRQRELPFLFGRKWPFISLNNSCSSKENLPDSGRVCTNHAKNYAQIGCAMQLNGITWIPSLHYGFSKSLE